RVTAGVIEIALDDAAAFPLLNHMCQLMGQQQPPRRRSRRVSACPKHQVGSDGIGIGADIQRRLLGRGIGMDPNSGEVVAEMLFYVPPQCRFERRTGSVERSVHARWRDVGSPGWPCSEPLHAPGDRAGWKMP